MLVQHGADLFLVLQREKFVVPLRAISGVGFIEAPSRIEFDVTPVNVKTEKTVLLRNTGTKAVDFTVTTDGPFSSSCRRCFLDVGDSAQVRKCGGDVCGETARDAANLPLALSNDQHARNASSKLGRI